MPELACTIRGAQAVLPHGIARVDLGVGADGRIAALAAPGLLDGGPVIEADGLIVLPGGIDLHVHLATFFGGTTTRDDFASGTRAALFGGTTTIAQFAIPRPGETSQEAIERTLDEARAAALADVVVHGAVIRETYEASLEQLASLPACGIRTVKVFSAYTDDIGLSIGRIHRLLRAAAAAGITVFVHAETDGLIREGIDDAVRDLGLGAPAHARSRSPLAEAHAIRSVADLAADTGATVYIVHVSSAEGIAVLAERRARGDRLLAETCPHYLFLDESVYDRPDGERWICSPPIRSARHREALWDAARVGLVDAVSSDHNCFDTAQKAAGAGDFRRVPNGLPGIESRLPLLVSAAIDGRLSWQRMAEVTSAAPARILGLWPRKGALAVGSEADLVLVDPAGRTALGALHMDTDFSPYEGLTVPGRIEQVFRRGKVVVHGDELWAEPGSGRWIALGSDGPVPAAVPGGRSAPSPRAR